MDLRLFVDIIIFERVTYFEICALEPVIYTFVVREMSENFEEACCYEPWLWAMQPLQFHIGWPQMYVQPAVFP